MTFGGAEEPLPLVGESLPATHYPRLNSEPVSRYYVMTDGSGGVWTLLYEKPRLESGWDGAEVPRERVHVVRLDRPADEQIIDANLVTFGKRLLFMVDAPATPDQPTRVRVLHPGNGGQETAITIPARGRGLLLGPDDKVFIFYTEETSGESRQIVVRSDGSYQRVLPPRRKANKAGPLLGSSLSAFDASGDYLIRQHPDGQLIFYSTRDEKDLDFGMQDWFSGPDSLDPAFYTCDRKGLKRVPFDRSPPTILDTAACWILYFTLFANSDDIKSQHDNLLYAGANGYFMVPALGGPIEKLDLPDASWLLALSPQHSGAYTLNVGYQYSNENQDTMTDGWIGDWRFMTRGHEVDWSKDGTRLRWLENAARTDNTGDLRSVRVADGPQSMRLLSRNVYDYGRLRDGRLLAVTNAANYNPASRIILIEEDEQVARRVVENAHAFKVIPESNDILISVWPNASGIDVYRVPLPAK